MSKVPGPLPKRAAQRRRRNQPDREVTSAAGAVDVTMPEPDASWHPAALAWYRSLAESGQSVWYQPSDYATAWVLAEVLSRALERPRPFGLLIQAWASGAAELLATEGSRRRVRVELERSGGPDADAEAAVSALDEYRKRLR